MANPTTDEMYNADSREIQMKYNIFFKEGVQPLVVTIDNYLISSTGLEEAQSDSQSLLGKVSSNEISLSLYNDTGIFTPTNSDSPYYGFIKKGVKIEAFGRAVDGDNLTDWDALGTYYVTDWATEAQGLVASVTANDKLYSIFDAPKPLYYVNKNVTIKSLYESFFTSLGIDYNIDSSLNIPLLYGYIDADNKSFISDLTLGALALCYGNREDGVDVVSRIGTRTLRATLTDNDQLIAIKTEQNIDDGYDGISLTCSAKQESADTTLVNLRDQVVSKGTIEMNDLAPQKTPIVRLKLAEVDSDKDIMIDSMKSIPDRIDLVVTNKDAETTSTITVTGTYLDTVKTVTSDNGNNLLSLSSNYLQTDAQCTEATRYLRNIVENKTPTLKIDIRGNFKLKLGDKVRVQSTLYKTDYTGIITRIDYKYQGNLKSTLTLVDASLFEEVP